MAQVELPPGVPDFETFVKERQAELTTKKKEKKRSGIPFWPNFAATKGAGASAQIAAALASKVGMMAVFGAVSAVVGGAGLFHRLQIQREAEGLKKKQFQTSLLRDHIIQQNQQAKANIGSAVPSIDGVRNDTIGFVKAGELAAPSAADAAAAAAAEAAKNGDGAKDGDGAKGDEAPAGMDPNAIAAQMMGQAQGAQGAGGARGGSGAGGAAFGKLSQGLGGMRGGGGMSGGVGRGFDQGNMQNSMLAKAQAMKSGDSGASITKSLTRKGKMRSLVSRRNITAKARGSGDAAKLRAMSADMAANRTGTADKAAAANTASWEAAAPGGQQVSGPAASAPSAQTGGSSFGFPEQAEGGPVFAGGNPADVDLGAQVPTIPDFENVTPYQWAVDIAKMLMMVITALAAFIVVCNLTGIGSTIVPTIISIIAALGGILALLGIYMVAMGQYVQGTIWTVLGGVVAGLALAAGAFTGVAQEVIMPYFMSVSTLLLGGAGAATANLAHETDTEDDVEEHKKNYRKKYGVDPDTKRVANPEKWDKRYGDGSAQEYNDQRQYDDMS